MIYDLIILGGGPAGSAAAVYAARKNLKSLLIAESFSGQSVVSPKIENWIGTPAISGGDLAKSLKNHVLAYAGEWLEVKEKEKVVKVEKTENNFKITTDKNNSFETKSLLVATGSSRKKLTALNALNFEHKGITYCASCDGPMFSGADVIVVGGGNAGFESAMQLLKYAKTVTLVHRGADFKADAITVKKVLAHPNVTGILNADITEVVGNDFVTGMKYKDKVTGEAKELQATGIFVEIGQTPNTEFVKDLVAFDDYGKIKVDPKTQMSSTPGIWAAGDCTDGLYHQNNIAAGDAIKALENIYIYLHTK